MEETEKVVAEIREVDLETATNKRHVEELEAALKKARAKGKGLLKKRERLTSLVQAFAEPRRRELLEEGEPSKTFYFSRGGSASWYFPSKSKLIVTGKAAAIIRSIKRLRPDDWEDFVRVKEELDKDAVKTHSDLVNKLRGVRIEYGELFRVDP